MKINKISKLKSGRYKILFDNNDSIITFDNVILNNKLLFNKEIDKELLIDIKNQNEYYELLDKSIKLISKRLRSEFEIKNYLETKTNNIILIDNIIDELKIQNLINDQRFAKAYINDKINLSNDGIFKIKNNLLNLGIDEAFIDLELKKNKANINNDKLDKLVMKKIKVNHKYSNYMLKQKILNDMLNLGYDRDEIIRSINNYLIDDKDIYLNEYKRLYNKYKNKYNDAELKYQVEKRLLAKGFKKN